MILRKLGEGGMAEVWYAENVIGKRAAVKILKPQFCYSNQIVQRFKNEAKLMVRLQHPNICQVFDYAVVDNRPSIIMEYLEGCDFKDLLEKKGRFSPEEAERYWNEIVPVLEYTHSQNVIHRDIKPSNIFLTTDGHIKLMDFGIAKIQDAVTGTQTGQTMGTLVYMSPEQIKDTKKVDYRSDIYSLAVTFTQLLTGIIPYDVNVNSEFDIMSNIVQKPLDLTGLPKDWQEFLKPYLAKDPKERPNLKYKINKDVMIINPEPNPVLTKSKLTADKDTSTEHISPVIPTSEKSKWKNIKKWIIILVAILSIVFALLIVFLVRNHTSEDTELENTFPVTEFVDTTVVEEEPVCEESAPTLNTKETKSERSTIEPHSKAEQKSTKNLSGEKTKTSSEQDADKSALASDLQYTKITFEKGSATPRIYDSGDNLKKSVEILKNNSGLKIVIEVTRYKDEDAELADQRVNAVKKIFLNKGVPREKIETAIYSLNDNFNNERSVFFRIVKSDM